MALLSDYTAGTVTVAANGTTVTGSGTAWQTAGFREGDWFIANGYVTVIASVDSDTQITLAFPWKGGALSGASYRLRYMSDGSRASAQARQLIDMLGGSGNLEAIAGLTFAANKLIKTTGPGTAELIDLSEVGIQDPNGKLAALRDATWAANKGLLLTGASTASTFDLTAFMRTLLDDADASAALTTLGVSNFIKGLLDDADAGAALTTLGVSSFIQTLLDDTTAATARATLGANNAANLTTGTLPDARVSSTLTPDKAYRRGNIIGAVSQSGGVPTGAIIEDGTNANGRYVKWANGTMHCMAALATSASADVTWTYPAAFAEVPTLFCGPTTNAASLVGAFFRNGATTTSADFAGYNASGRIALSCTQLAVGRWY